MRFSDRVQLERGRAGIPPHVHGTYAVLVRTQYGDSTVTHWHGATYVALCATARKRCGRCPSSSSIEQRGNETKPPPGDGAALRGPGAGGQWAAPLAINAHGARAGRAVLNPQLGRTQQQQRESTEQH